MDETSMAENVTYQRHSRGVYEVFAKSDGRRLGLAVRLREGRWYASGSAVVYEARREAGAALLMRSTLARTLVCSGEVE